MRKTDTALFWWAILLCGLFGLHRIYLKKYGTGLLWLVTFGLCGVGQLYDLFIIRRLVAEANAGVEPEPAPAREPAPASANGVTPVLLFQDDETNEIVGLPFHKIGEAAEAWMKRPRLVKCEYCGTKSVAGEPCKTCGASLS